MNNKTKDFVVVSFALFSMFFGAGNVIFPPFLGTISGDNFLSSGIGFMITGVGLPILGVVAISKSQNFENFSNKVFKNFHIILGSLIMIAIGPLLAIPKTAALTYEIGVTSLIPKANMYISVAIFFLVTLYFSFNSGNVIDRLGAVLTPLLIISLATLIIKGVIFPIGTPSFVENAADFPRGFEEGYQTMDALASVLFAGTMLNSLKRKGYQGNDVTNMASLTGILAGIGLLFVYFGMLYIGACATSAVAKDELFAMSKSQIVIFMSDAVLGKYGRIFLSIIIGLACLTTSVGLTITAGEFFEKITGGTLKYKFVVIFTCVFSCFMSYLGVDNIVAFSAPVLTALYPTTIILIIFNCLSVKNEYIYKGACLPVLLYSIPSAFLSAESKEIINSVYPLFTHTFGWIPVAIVGGLIGFIIGKLKK